VGSTPTFGTQKSGHLIGLFCFPVQFYNGVMAENIESPQQPAQQQKKRKRGDQLSSMQVMFAAILAVGLLLAINFSSRITAGQPLQEAYKRAQDEIERLQLEQEALIAERDYVQSDAFVELWARDEGKMVRPGEVLVIPVPAINSLPQPEANPAQSVPVQTTPRKPENWQVWWALFFDGAPPDGM
jgi:cell division protein FtsB